MEHEYGSRRDAAGNKDGSASNGLSIEDRSSESATRTYCASHFTVTDIIPPLSGQSCLHVGCCSIHWGPSGRYAITSTPMSASPSSRAPLVRSHNSSRTRLRCPFRPQTALMRWDLRSRSIIRAAKSPRRRSRLPSTFELRIFSCAVIRPPPLQPTSASGWRFGRSFRPSSMVLSQLKFTAQSRACSSTSSPPASSQSTLSSGVTLTQPSHALEEKTRDGFLESLRDTPELYNLTCAELENLVSIVVREPGFPRLLEALDSMSYHGFLGR
ncbi:hypothetical protein BC826DRAFT_54015 [Russula brevipes]|nr:hypothetical protein BC826DRAFT_54015 [Russula brevipes]